MCIKFWSSFIKFPRVITDLQVKANQVQSKSFLEYTILTKKNLKTKLYTYITVNPFVSKGTKLSVSYGNKEH